MECWEILCKHRNVATTNESKVCSCKNILNRRLQMGGKLSATGQELRAFCVALVINLGVKECMKILRNHLENPRPVVIAVRKSQKRREMFEKRMVEPWIDGLWVAALDMETPWSRTYTIPRAVLKVQVVLKAILHGFEDLKSFQIVVDRIEELLELSAFKS